MHFISCPELHSSQASVQLFAALKMLLVELFLISIHLESIKIFI